MENSAQPDTEAKKIADLKAREHEINIKERELAAHEAAVITHQNQLISERQDIEQEKVKLIRRAQDIMQAEQNRDAGFADERAALNAELREKRDQMEKEFIQIREDKLLALEDEIIELRTKRLGKVALDENAERERIQAEIAKEREAWTKQQDDARKLLSAAQVELEKQKGALNALRSELEGRKAELEGAERIIERQEQRLEQQWTRRNEKLDDEVEQRIEEYRKSLENFQESAKEENIRLRNALRTQTELLSAFEQLRQQLGGKDPAEILHALNSQADELKRLREELATRPTEEVRERYQTLESEAKNQKARADEREQEIAAMQADIAEVGDLRRHNAELKAENKSLAQRVSIFEGAANEAQAELNRLRAAYERPAEIEARYKEIEMPHIGQGTAKQPAEAAVDEMTWLTSIGNACDTYGLHFNPRILKAFHTALKTAEWSPLTVLAGVSGTGKSELPRLYSHFGGIYFEPLSVQPNWDSQESMLGFFNSIDNKFDAQPVLRFLAQSQKPWSEGYPGLQDAVCLVLLDEMNLAHPEFYFAEFLSKLELRRGRKGCDVPFIPVKIGAGMKPYELPLGRNVLWTGTMNQDETTKSLSDKVLDRSIIINFPRPAELKRRLRLASLDHKNRGSALLEALRQSSLAQGSCFSDDQTKPDQSKGGPALHKASWQSWLAQGSCFSDDQVKPFKDFIERINASLAVTGRALGHRVWQSIEYYMANYPDVRAAADKDALAKAMHIAFEDQLVQKVMPKLRGIDTRGKSKTECLDKIRGQIMAGINGNPFNLAEDFDLACELGYGQFIWQSANYLNTSDAEVNGRSSTNRDSGGGEDPPPLFMRDEPDSEKRRRQWNARTQEQQDQLREQLEENARAGRIPSKQ